MKDFFVRECLKNQNDYTVATVNADIILNANESNYPLPEELAEKMSKIAANFPFHRYPPVKAENLCEIIAEDLDVDSECIRIGNGSSDLLEKACYVFGGEGSKIAIPYPSFAMYGEYVALSGSEPCYYSLNNEGFIDADNVIELCLQEKPSLLIICNPNNPTGNYNSLAVIEKIIASVECPVILDEAYMEFADGKEMPPNDMRPLHKLWLVAGSALSLLGRYSNFIVLRTFSKAYGLAGLRCGYGAGSLFLMRHLGKAILPYHVNAFTLYMAKMVYENKELYKGRIKTIDEERDKLAAYCRKMGFYVYPSSANFLLLKAEGLLMEHMAAKYAADYDESIEQQEASGKLLVRYLLENGILVSDFSAHPALQGCVRITIGVPEENKQLLNRITELCVALE